MDFEHKNIGEFYVLYCGKMPYAEAEKCADIANAMDFGGANDWVFSDTQTLRALQILAPERVWAWSASPYVGDSSYALGVDFRNGSVYNNYRYDDYAVRLVRASQVLEIGRAGKLKSIRKAGLKSEVGAEK